MGYVPGETIVVMAEVDNQSRRKMKSTFLKFVMVRSADRYLPHKNDIFPQKKPLPLKRVYLLHVFIYLTYTACVYVIEYTDLNIHSSASKQNRYRQNCWLRQRRSSSRWHRTVASWVPRAAASPVRPHPLWHHRCQIWDHSECLIRRNRNLTENTKQVWFFKYCRADDDTLWHQNKTLHYTCLHANQKYNILLVIKHKASAIRNRMA